MKDHSLVWVRASGIAALLLCIALAVYLLPRQLSLDLSDPTTPFKDLGQR